MPNVSGQRKIYEMINSRIISLLEKGEVSWKKPWVSGEPVNFITQKPYRGINPFVLISSGFSCPYFGTSVKWIGMTADDAREVGKTLIKHAKKIYKGSI